MREDEDDRRQDENTSQGEVDMGKSSAAQDGLTEKHRRDESTQSVDCLSKVQPLRGSLRIAELCDTSNPQPY